MSGEAQWPSHRAPSVGTQLAMCVLMFKSSHRPNGEIADVLAPTHSCTTAADAFGQLQYVRAAETCNFPIAPMGNSRFARCLQGGGVAVLGGTVTISSCTISGNTALNVRARPQKFPSPRWEICRRACLDSRLATLADIPVNYRMYVLQRPRNFPSPRWETHVLLVACRVVVSMSGEAQWPSHRAPSVGTQLAMCVLMFPSPLWESC
jgi:hypothetical protein